MALNQVTLEMLEMLPSWMKMKSDPDNSEGAKFLNVAGRQLYDIEALINNILYSHHLDIHPDSGVDIAAVDVLYKVQAMPETIIDDMKISGMYNGILYQLQKASTAYDFYLIEDNVGKYYIDTSSYTIYVHTKFDSLIVNGALFPDVLEHNVWGPYDEIGLLLGCPRIQGERNEAYVDSQGIERIGYRNRLYDVFKNPGNSTKQGLINFISRSFSISNEDIQINELDDSFVQSLINSDGTIKAELKEYLLLSNRINLSTSDVYWDILEESRAGLSYLPIIWNVTLNKWNNDSIQNGIGDTTDIEVIGPDQETVKQSFTYHVGTEGLRLSQKKIYPEHQLGYRVFATGQKYDDDYKPESYQYSVIASELVPLKFNVKAHKRYTHDIQQDFSASIEAGTLVDYETASSADKKPDKYVGNQIIITPGSTVMNKNAEFIEVLANLGTTNKAETPQIANITLNYKTTGGVPKQIVISGDSAQSQNGSTITTGFEANTWNDASPILKVRSDTADQYQTTFDTASSALKLTHGVYEKIYNSEGDWDDGEKMNLRVSSSGTIKLSI